MILKHAIRFIVEGGDDQHFVKHFLRRSFNLDLNPAQIVSAGDQGRAIELLTAAVNETDYQALGLIIDADSDPNDTWTKVRRAAGPDREGNFYLPAAPDPAGTVVGFVRSSRLGVWLMPEPNQPGDLEKFLTTIRQSGPAQDELWNLALSSVPLHPPLRLFPNKDQHKAEFRTWLAWQKEPGASPGLALSQGAFDLSLPLAQRFESWLARLLA